MRMSKLFAALLVVLTTLIPDAHAVDAPATFSFQGSGYGHGVGLSQMGARSMALNGKSSNEILQYYFKDVQIESIDDSKLVRINIGHLLSSAKISSATKDSLISVYSGDISGKTDVYPVSHGTSISLSILGSSVLIKTTNAKAEPITHVNKIFTLRWSGTRYLAGPDAIVSVTHSGTTQKFRYGQIQVKAVKSVSGYRLEVTNTVRVADEYLWGVSEMPSYWPVAALEAQAIASRSYALSKAGIYKKACDCELYGGISDQSFIGYAKEIEKKYGAVWKETVTRTAGLVLTQAGLPITAYFSSSTGGKTESAVNAWGSNKPYTQIVDDPGSLDLVLNPRFVSWSREVPQNVVATAFLLPDVVTLEILSKNESGTVAQIRATSSSGIQAVLRGEAFRSRTKIPSAWFELVSVQN
jgi:stage II sporulation protein D